METYYRNSKKNVITENELTFQIIEWWAQDEDKLDDSDQDSETNETETKKYTIRCYGVTDKGETISCKINNYKPTYYIKVPNDIKQGHLISFKNYIKSSFLLIPGIIIGFLNIYFVLFKTIYFDHPLPSSNLDEKSFFGYITIFGYFNAIL